MTRSYENLSGEERRALLDRALDDHGWVCCICGLGIQQGEESLQHITPRSRGGSNRRDNLAPAHKRCNFSLGNKVLKGPSGIIHDGLSWFDIDPVFLNEKKAPPMRLNPGGPPDLL